MLNAEAKLKLLWGLLILFWAVGCLFGECFGGSGACQEPVGGLLLWKSEAWLEGRFATSEPYPETFDARDCFEACESANCRDVSCAHSARVQNEE